MTPGDLARLLALPERPRTAPPVLSRSVEEHDGWTLERLVLEIGGIAVRGLLARPSAPRDRLPAVLYCHAHGARWEIGASELVDGRPSLPGPYGPLLAGRGFVTLCIDMPAFGARAGAGEDALAKALLWQGKTLMGLMLADLLSAFDHLSSRDDVDPARIAAFGLSMGATHAYFLAALEPRIARLAHLCCLADIGLMIGTGAHDLHAHYLTVPGLLAATGFGQIAGMAAPRPQLVCTGALDPLTPPAAADRAFAEALAAYRAAGAADALVRLVEPDSGHVETARMRAAVLDFLDAMR